MATRQFFGFSTFSIAIDRADSMDHMFCRQPSACRDHRPPWGQASNLTNNSPAFRQYRRSASFVNGAIDSTSAQKRRVCRVYHCVGRLLGNVSRTVKLDGLPVV